MFPWVVPTQLLFFVAGLQSYWKQLRSGDSEELQRTVRKAGHTHMGTVGECCSFWDWSFQCLACVTWTVLTVKRIVLFESRCKISMIKISKEQTRQRFRKLPGKKVSWFWQFVHVRTLNWLEVMSPCWQVLWCWRRNHFNVEEGA
jgi:hypothetical protein